MVINNQFTFESYLIKDPYEILCVPYHKPRIISDKQHSIINLKKINNVKKNSNYKVRDVCFLFSDSNLDSGLIKELFCCRQILITQYYVMTCISRRLWMSMIDFTYFCAHVTPNYKSV